LYPLTAKKASGGFIILKKMARMNHYEGWSSDDDMPLSLLFPLEEDIPIAILYSNAMRYPVVPQGTYVLTRGHPFLPGLTGVHPRQYAMEVGVAQVVKACTMYDAELEVNFCVSSNANINGRWSPCFNTSNKRWIGMVERSSVLLFDAKITRGGKKLALSTKKVISEHEGIPEYTLVGSDLVRTPAAQLAARLFE
jgi:hypothetical protein